MNITPHNPDFNPEQNLTMSSREIAELCEKRHDNVMADIQKMLKDIGLNAPDFSGTYKTKQGNTYDCFVLPKDLTVTLITGYRADLRYKVVKRLEELEGQGQPANLSGPLLMATALIEADATMKAQAAKIEAIQPKADRYDEYLSEDATVSIEKFSNKYGVKRTYPAKVLRSRQMVHQKKLMATLKGSQSGIVKNVVDRNEFEYTDRHGNQIEAQSVQIIKASEDILLGMLVRDFGKTAFRNGHAFEKANSLQMNLGGAA